MGSQCSKEKILVCARELFYRVGYQSTSVDDILKECGVAKSNFYYHFKSKEDLAGAVIDRQIEDFEVMLLTSLQNRALDPAQRLFEFCVCLCNMEAQHQHLSGCPFGNFVAALSTRGDEQAERFRLRFGALFQRIEGTLRDCLAEGASRGQFRNDIGPNDMATMALGTIEGLLMLTKTYHDRAPLVNGLVTVQRMLRP